MEIFRLVKSRGVWRNGWRGENSVWRIPRRNVHQTRGMMSCFSREVNFTIVSCNHLFAYSCWFNQRNVRTRWCFFRNNQAHSARFQKHRGVLFLCTDWTSLIMWHQAPQIMHFFFISDTNARIPYIINSLYFLKSVLSGIETRLSSLYL
jgi:hypothetical protein